MLIHTFSGKRIDLCDVKSDDIDIVDIAHSLSNICRFGGHTKQFYSVAQHSLRVASIVSKEHKLEALLHDAAEAYIGDLIRPIKETFPVFSILEGHIMRRIKERFGTPYGLSNTVKAADDFMLCTESEELCTLPIVLSRCPQELYTVPSTPPAHKACEFFLKAFEIYRRY